MNCEVSRLLADVNVNEGKHRGGQRAPVGAEETEKLGAGQRFDGIPFGGHSHPPTEDSPLRH